MSTVLSSTLSRLCAATLLVCVLAPTARAEDDRLNGSWTLDAERSETYKSAAEKVNSQILEYRKRQRAKQFGDSNRQRSSNKYDNQRRAAEDLMREDRGEINWALTDELSAVMEASALKIYQARMCAILYDKRLKRLFPINPDGNSYSVKGNQVAKDEVGKTLGWFEGKRLVIETDVRGGDRLAEKLEVNEAGDELNVETRLTRRDLGRTIQYKRIYRRD